MYHPTIWKNMSESRIFSWKNIKGIHESSIPPYCMGPMQSYINENPPKTAWFQVRWQVTRVQLSGQRFPHSPTGRALVLKRFRTKRKMEIMEFQFPTSWNSGGCTTWKFKQQSVSFSLLRSPFHPSGHLVNRTSKGEFMPCKSLHRSFLQDSSLAVACRLQRCSHWINCFPKDLVLHFEQEPPVAFFEILIGW